MQAFRKPDWIDDPYNEDNKVQDILIDTFYEAPYKYATYGFFQTLYEMRLHNIYNEHKYTTEEGNPLEAWERWEWSESQGQDVITGLDYEALDALYLMRSGEKTMNKKLADQVLFRYRNKSETWALYPNEAIATYIVGPLVRMYSRKWLSIWNSLFYDYNPIENYNMVETMEDDERVIEYGKETSRTLDNMQHHKTGTETETPAVTITETKTPGIVVTEEETREHEETETSTPGVTITEAETVSRSEDETETPGVTITETETPRAGRDETKSVYGFNSSSPSPSEKVSVEQTGTNTKTTAPSGGHNTKNLDIDGSTTKTTSPDGSDEKTRENSETVTKTITPTGIETVETAPSGTNQMVYNTTDTDSGTETLENSGSDTETRNYTLKRSGNIGVTTTQQMIEQERQILMYDYFVNVVFPDIDKFVANAVY